MGKKHPRDRFFTVYGRKPVLEILENEDLRIDKVIIAKKAKGDIIKKIVRFCSNRDIVLKREDASFVSRISKNPKQDQGVVADVIMDGMEDATEFFKHNDKDLNIIALDGITTPANVGMIIRTATALGIDAIMIPRKGNAKLSSLVIKASAGVVFRSKILKCENLEEALLAAQQNDFKIYGLAGEASYNIYEREFYTRNIFVMGNETEGISVETRALTDEFLHIPMAKGVESLNVACAATVVASEIMRRK